MSERNDIRSLIALLSDSRAANRIAALVALADSKTKVPLSRIYAALTDSDRSVRAAAAFALSKVGTRKSLPYLLNAWKTTTLRDNHLRRQLLVALGDIGGGQAFAELLGSFAKWDSKLQKLAVGFLAEKGETNGPLLLKRLLRQQLKPQIRAIIQKTLEEAHAK
jgi:HEAT repeat protein